MSCNLWDGDSTNGTMLADLCSGFAAPGPLIAVPGDQLYCRGLYTATQTFYTPMPPTAVPPGALGPPPAILEYALPPTLVSVNSTTATVAVSLAPGSFVPPAGIGASLQFTWPAGISGSGTGSETFALRSTTTTVLDAGSTGSAADLAALTGAPSNASAAAAGGGDAVTVVPGTAQPLAFVTTAADGTTTTTVAPGVQTVVVFTFPLPPGGLPLPPPDANTATTGYTNASVTSASVGAAMRECQRAAGSECVGSPMEAAACGGCEASAQCAAQRACRWAGQRCRCREDLGQRSVTGASNYSTAAAPAFTPAIMFVDPATNATQGLTSLSEMPHFTVNLTLGPGRFELRVEVVVVGGHAARGARLTVEVNSSMTAYTNGVELRSASRGCVNGSVAATQCYPQPPNATDALQRRRRQASAATSSAPLQPGQLWATQHWAEAPGFLQADLWLVVRISADNAAPQKLYARLPHDVRALVDVVDAANGTTIVLSPHPPPLYVTQPNGGASAPGGHGTPSTGATTTDGDTVTTLPPDDPRTAAPVPATQMLRNVFSLTSGCGGTHFLPIFVLVCLWLLLVRCLHAATTKRHHPEGPHGVTAYRWHDVGWPQALRPRHVWLGLLVPCTPHCGTVHTAEFTVHCLDLFATAAVLLNAVPSLSDTLAANALCAVVTVVVAAALQPLHEALYRWYQFHDVRVDHAPPPAGLDSEQELRPFGVPPQLHVGSQSDIRRIDFVEPADAGEMPDGVAAAGRLDEATPSVVDVTAILERCRGDGRSCPSGRPNPAVCLMVDCNGYRVAGHALSFVCGVLSFAVCFASTATWCPAMWRVFAVCVAFVAAFDIFAAQPFFLAAIYVWQWLVDDADETLDERTHRVQADEEELGSSSVRRIDAPRGLSFQAHPFHGQAVYVGPAYDDEGAADEKPRRVVPYRRWRRTADGHIVAVGATRVAAPGSRHPSTGAPTADADAPAVRGDDGGDANANVDDISV